MSDKSNPYTIREVTEDEVTCYYVSFTDGQGIPQNVEISREVYLEFINSNRRERKSQRWNERHTEFFSLTDEELYRRKLNPLLSVEDKFHSILQAECLRRAIAGLSKKRKRRFLLYYGYGLTQRQIAEIEGCTKQAVNETILSAEQEIIKILKTIEL